MSGRLTIAVALLGLLLGVGLGLLAGWVVWPAQYDSIAPELLAIDHQIDYANLIAAQYTRTSNLDVARTYLARLGPAAGDILRRAALTDPATARLLGDLATAAPSSDATAQPTPTAD